MLIQRLAQRWAIPIKNRLCRSKVGEGIFSGRPVRLALPQTSMNLSGEAVGCLIQRWRVELSSLLVVCDDLSLPVGMIRIRGQGSDGGHRGLASVLEVLKTDAVQRLRIGIRAPKVPEDLVGFVLGRFEASEKKGLEEGLNLSEEACEAWVSRGLSAAMNRFNRRLECKV